MYFTPIKFDAKSDTKRYVIQVDSRYILDPASFYAILKQNFVVIKNVRRLNAYDYEYQLDFANARLKTNAYAAINYTAKLPRPMKDYVFSVQGAKTLNARASSVDNWFPKLFFLDTGLAAYLTRWTSADVLKCGAMAGAFFESFVISEIIKSYYNKGIIDPPLYFYRDKDMNEIDLLIEENGTLYPLEMKKHADPQKKDMDAFDLLDKIPGVRRGPGGVICLYDRLISLKGSDRVIPINYL